MHKILQTIIFSCVLAITVTPLSVTAGFFDEKIGQHLGESKRFEYWVEYLNPLGITTVDATGITYNPFSFPSTKDENTILPERYFAKYPLYFSNAPVSFLLHLKNTSKRTFNNLFVIVRQEQINTEGNSGEPFPSPNSSQWFIRTFSPGEETTLNGTVVVSDAVPSGIDQTHLQIIHWDNSNKQQTSKGAGRIILDDPQAGLWCPLSS